MYIEKKNKPKNITNRPTAIARLKKSCWIKPKDELSVVCRPVVIRVARTGGIRRPIELCMYHPPTQKALRTVRGKLFDGLCMGQPPDAFLGRKSPSATPQRGRKRVRNIQKEDDYIDEPVIKRRRQVRTARRQPRAIPHDNRPALPPGTLPKAKPPGPGYCHNCKKARDSCLVCPNVRTHRFCTNCVSRHFADDYEIIFNQGVDCWEQRDGCPVCFWQCPCAACKRRMLNKKSKAKGKARAMPAKEKLAEEDEEEEEEEAEERAEQVAGGHVTEEEQLLEDEEEEEESESETAEAGELAEAEVKLMEEEDEEAAAEAGVFAMDEDEDYEGDIEEQDSEQEDENLHDLKNEDNGEANVEGHTHSEEDRHEQEIMALRVRNRRKRRLQKKKADGTLAVWTPAQTGAIASDDDGVEEEDDDDEEDEGVLLEEDNSRPLNWTPFKIVARRQRAGQREYFVMWKDRWLTGDDTVSLYRRGELKEILKKRKRKRHPIEYLVKRNFTWEKEDKVPQKLLDNWHKYYQTVVLLDERGKGKGKGEGWDQLWQNEQRKRQASGAPDAHDSE